MEFGKLPVDVLSKIVSYQVGEPEYMKMKNSRGLKEIQMKYKPQVYGLETATLIDYNEDEITETFNFIIKPKIKSMEYVLTLILKQTEYIKKLIEQSHLMYLQPDMEKGLMIDLECDYDEEYISDDPFVNNKRKFAVNFQTDIDSIQEALNELYEDMFDLIDTKCEEEYDIVRIDKLYFTIGVWTFLPNP